MKKHISIFMLLVRTSIWKVLLVLCGMVMSQVLLFFAMGAGEEVYLPDALGRIPFFVVVCVGLGLMSAVLAIPMSDRGGRMNNLLLRLGLPERDIFWVQVLFNAMVFWTFILAQGLMMVLLCMIHDWVTPGEMDPMAVFVTSYQHPLFHRFFPLHDVVEWINQIILVTGFSICTAAVPMRQRHRFNSVSSTVMLMYTMSYYSSMDAGVHLEGSKMILPMILTACVVVVCLYGVLTMEVDDYGKT